MKTRALDWERAGIVLRQVGLRATLARRALLVAMYEMGPLTEGEIAERVGRYSPDQATLYRNLSTLQRVGLVKRHRFSSRVFHFSLHLPGEPTCDHPHFLCEDCGKCECLEDTKVSVKPLKLEDRVVTSVEIVVNGVCNVCRKRRGKREGECT